MKQAPTPIVMPYSCCSDGPLGSQPPYWPPVTMTWLVLLLIHRPLEELGWVQLLLQAIPLEIDMLWVESTNIPWPWFRHINGLSNWNAPQSDEATLQLI